jgi:hypothetical protein
VVGQFKDDRIQNITGKAGTIAKISGSMSGALYQDGGTAGVTRGSSDAYYNINFDASKVARTGSTTRTKEKGVTYIIKVL